MAILLVCVCAAQFGKGIDASEILVIGKRSSLEVVASASPDSLKTGETVSFSLTATNPSNGFLNYSWRFGDGTRSGEQNPTHVYTAPGTYNVKVKVSDGKGGRSTDTVSITVTGEKIDKPDGEDGDDNSGITPTDKFKTSKLQISLNFTKPNSDYITASGSLFLDDGFEAKGTEISLNIAGIERTFILDKKVRAKGSKENRRDQFSMKTNYERVEQEKKDHDREIIREGKPKLIKVFAAGDAKWKAKFQKADFKEVFAAYGLKNEDVKKKLVEIPVTLTLEGVEYQDLITVKYKGKLDKSGKGSGKKK